jgi:hypothetical protein
MEARHLRMPAGDSAPSPANVGKYHKNACNCNGLVPKTADSSPSHPSDFIPTRHRAMQILLRIRRQIDTFDPAIQVADGPREGIFPPAIAQQHSLLSARDRGHSGR